MSSAASVPSCETKVACEKAPPVGPAPPLPPWPPFPFSASVRVVVHRSRMESIDSAEKASIAWSCSSVKSVCAPCLSNDSISLALLASSAFLLCLPPPAPSSAAAPCSLVLASV